ncbi:conserved exported protein of unknown function [Nitrospira sp. KM1]|uniref:hypothetical protein n=1 Tax=Nitrospira sp. KM1 TaxID=1936990 RepID=UPI0013A717C8|nr:hypothetical protein [Nitrospira sp. KM1]BCA53535.1 conserved exported protein of unknown function [Nitrospira sp. KM1]
MSSLTSPADHNQMFHGFSLAAISLVHLVVFALPALAVLIAPGTGAAEEELLIFAVVSEAPKDKTHVAVKASINDVASDTRLIASDSILSNPVWKKLEICHALRADGAKVPEGYRVTTVRVIDASMLPMTLQSFAGDCLIKKAIDIAPLVD